MGWTDIIQITFALLAVLGLIGLCAIGARKAGLTAMSSNFSQKRRLALVETLALDARRRVAIIKCDDTEHLIVLGANGETIIKNDLPAKAGQPCVQLAPARKRADEPPQQNPFAILRALQKHARGETAAPIGRPAHNADAA